MAKSAKIITLTNFQGYGPVFFPKFQVDQMKVDFHIHSNCSDGELEPRDILRSAAEVGCEMFSITDHDSIAAYGMLEDDLKGEKPRIVPGCEFSVSWERHEVHVVGLNFDLGSPKLKSAITQQNLTRRNRSVAIAQRLETAGVTDILAKAYSLSGKGPPGRLHFAQALVAKGIVRNIQQAFDRFLGAGQVAFVETSWLSLGEVCEVVQSAGGSAVLAHPLKYGFSNSRLMKLLEDFGLVGGDALEVISGNQNRDKTTHLARLARKFDFAASVGSDFHRLNAPWASIGRLPALPGICRPIWSDWLI